MGVKPETTGEIADAILSGQMDVRDGLAAARAPRYAVTALLMKKTETGFNFQLMLNVIRAPDERTARADFGLRAKDAWPEYGLHEVLAVEVAGG